MLPHGISVPVGVEGVEDGRLINRIVQLCETFVEKAAGPATDTDLSEPLGDAKGRGE